MGILFKEVECGVVKLGNGVNVEVVLEYVKKEIFVLSLKILWNDVVEFFFRGEMLRDVYECV